jgi:hypothetical protein
VPADLDPVAALEDALAVGWGYRAEVLVGAPLADLAPWLPASLGRLAAVDATTTRLTGTTSNPWWYAGQLAARLAELDAPVEVVGGPELRATTRAVGRRLVAATTDGP